MRCSFYLIATEIVRKGVLWRRGFSFSCLFILSECFVLVRPNVKSMSKMKNPIEHTIYNKKKLAERRSLTEDSKICFCLKCENELFRLILGHHFGFLFHRILGC